MKIGIIDADLIGRNKQRFPNLACMKISSYWKAQASEVQLLLSYDNIEQFDQVYISKVFLDTQIDNAILNRQNVQYGGTGFFYDKSPPLPDEIEHSMPDYHLYDAWVNHMMTSRGKRTDFKYYTDYSIGFTTRGCIRGCKFCVNQHYKESKKHSPISEFFDPSRKYVCLLDDNVFACKDWKAIFDELHETGRKFQYKQGLDERLLTPEKCEALFNSSWIGDIIFAFDNIKDRDIIERKLQLVRKYTNRIPKFYVFCGFNHNAPDSYDENFWAKDITDLFERIDVLRSYKCLPYIMRYKDYELSPYRGMYITITRWCNQPNFFKKESFREYVASNGVGSAAYKYVMDFEAKYPDVAACYFDTKRIDW